ncbi:hypothetical protein [Salinarimonas soli]|uniref:FlgO domain-containing protein n=1 Tax=Salinarimonas soli TaxID=1638099 RepID=A0A5B2V9E8_9HYPH|nr:hypothetical protein [Salinarimonas soli]KAA2235070.1 hypothetical protein F0L46_22320 [Salinarimonas soli]
MRSLRFLALPLLALGCALAGPVEAQTAVKRVNILVMSDDTDTDAVPRFNRIFNRVQARMMETLNLKGYQVYDETASGLEVAATNRVRRSEAELIEVARAVRVPIDAAVVYRIYASSRKSPSGAISRPEVRVEARVLNVRSGQFVTAFEAGGYQLPPLPVNCDRECLLERVGAEADLISADVASGVVERLTAFIGIPAPGAPPAMAVAAPGGGVPMSASGEACPPVLPTAYQIRLRDFQPEEVSQVEELLVRFACYESHRPTRVGGSVADYWYETRSDQARLMRNLRQMLDFMGVRGNITMGDNSGAVDIRKTVTR